MKIEEIKQELSEKGYVVVPNVLTEDQVKYCKKIFKDWQKTIPNHDVMHNSVNPHGIYKFHEVGHQEFAWYLRTKPQIINIKDHFTIDITSTVVRTINGNTLLNSSLLVITDPYLL